MLNCSRVKWLIVLIFVHIGVTRIKQKSKYDFGAKFCPHEVSFAKFQKCHCMLVFLGSSHFVVPIVVLSGLAGYEQ